ncbi:MAG: T9SS C-terminal target domain-containing protein, partial [Bacteroidetes bacterium]
MQVTFRVDMNDEIVNASGVYVAGSFQDPAWVKDALEMLDGDGDGINTYTAAIVPGEYQFKFYNGDCGDACGETADFETPECGVSYGVGGWNRVLDIQGLTTDTTLSAVVYNACRLSNVSIDEALAASFDIFPNPAYDQVTIRLEEAFSPNFSVALTTLTGQRLQVIRDVRSQEVVLDLQGLTSGLYLFTLTPATAPPSPKNSLSNSLN